MPTPFNYRHLRFILSYKKEKTSGVKGINTQGLCLCVYHGKMFASTHFLRNSKITIMNKNRVMVAMSGGIDSSITALMLKEQGYEIVGATLRIWDYLSEGCEEKETGCCSMESIFEAKDFCESIGADHHLIDIREDFKNSVVQNFIDEYLDGRTPNPCVVCNPLIKWGEILKKANELNCYYIATGHYSRIAEQNGRWFLTKGKDLSKDQTYVLWQLSQEQIQRTLLPLGDYYKSEVKQMAADKGYVKLSKKRESQEVCFIPDNDYRGFLKKRVSGLEEKVSGGIYVDTEGKKLGTHQGYPFYTIGQRKGLNIALGHPAFVLDIDKVTNTVTLGKRDDLLSNKIFVSSYNGLKYEQLRAGQEVDIKIRYNTKPAACKILSVENGLIEVELPQPVSAPTPGQSAVFYEGSDVVGGGLIEKR